MAHLAATSTQMIAELVAHATEALDGKTNALAWLNKPNSAMQGRTPLDVLSQGSPADCQRLDEQLTALEYGMHP